MKSERRSQVKERVKQEIFDGATFDTDSATSQYLPIKEEKINMKIEHASFQPHTNVAL